MTDLHIDTAILRQTGAGLRAVADEFEHANHRVDDVGAILGHDTLAERVRSFAHNWDDRRAEMLESIAQLAEAAQVVGETFEQIETDLVNALTGKS
jgi:hypothetical protein